MAGTLVAALEARGIAVDSEAFVAEVNAGRKVLHEAGIRTVMITGDQQLTALSIARQLGITDGGEAINGRELASMPPDELDRRLDKVAVFNRVSPTDKLRIVEAFECGAIVNPDGLRKQVEGAVVQGLGGALREAVEFAD